MMYGWNADGGWGALWMILGMVIFWAALVMVVFLLVRSGDRGRSDDQPNAVEMLRRRFANGEIPKEEYEDRLRTLRELKT